MMNHTSLRFVLMLSVILAAVLPLLIVGYISLRTLTVSKEKDGLRGQQPPFPSKRNDKDML